MGTSLPGIGGGVSAVSTVGAASALIVGEPAIGTEPEKAGSAGPPTPGLPSGRLAPACPCPGALAVAATAARSLLVWGWAELAPALKLPKPLSISARASS